MSDATARPSASARRKPRPVVVIASVAVITILAAVWMAWDREAIAAWKRDAGVFPFFTAMAALPAIGFPITPFCILAGATFGARVGLIGTGIALALNLTLCYAIARRLRPRVGSLLRRFSYDLPYFGERQRGAVRFTLAVKMTPGVPAFAKNYGLGVAGVSFAVYFGLSMIITGTYAASLILIGESLFDHRGDRFVPTAVLVIAIGLGLWLWRRHRHRPQPKPGE